MLDHFPLPRRSLVMIWWNCKQRSTCWIGKEQKMVWDTSLWFTRSRVSWLEFWRYKWWEYWLLNWEADDYIHTFEFWMRKVRLRWNMKHQQKLYKNWFSSTSSWLDYASVLLGGGGFWNLLVLMSCWVGDVKYKYLTFEDAKCALKHPCFQFYTKLRGGKVLE